MLLFSLNQLNKSDFKLLQWFLGYQTSHFKKLLRVIIITALLHLLGLFSKALKSM